MRQCIERYNKNILGVIRGSVTLCVAPQRNLLASMDFLNANLAGKPNTPCLFSGGAAEGVSFIHIKRIISTPAWGAARCSLRLYPMGVNGAEGDNEVLREGVATGRGTDENTLHRVGRAPCGRPAGPQELWYE